MRINYIIVIILSGCLISSIEPFGHDLLSLFALDPTYININHGSYGSAPKYVHEKLIQYQLTAEANPDRWFRLEIQTLMQTVREKLSQYVNCDTDDLVIIDNASAGVNSILKSLKFDSDSSILYYNVAYGMVKLTLQYVSSEIFKQEQIVQIDLDQNTIQNTDLLLAHTQDAINRLKNVKLIIFDHISSTPAIRFEVDKMVKYFRQQNILTLIDGAHAVGAIPIDLKRIDPDFYLSNNHKWLYSHRSSCLLYVRKSLQSMVHPIITSFGYLQSYQNEFFWLGTKDYSAFLTILDALDFRRTIANESDIFIYNHDLAVRAGSLLAQLWNTSVLVSNSSFVSTMNNIELPSSVDSLDRMNYLYQLLVDQHNIFLPMFQFGGKFYARISAQIYMELSDYELVGKLVKNLTESMLQTDSYPVNRSMNKYVQ